MLFDMLLFGDSALVFLTDIQLNSTTVWSKFFFVVVILNWFVCVPGSMALDSIGMFLMHP